jgi:hypothetical protein
MRSGNLRRWNNGYLASTTTLPCKIARRQTQDMVRNRDWVGVVVGSYVPDSINQVACSNSSA